MAENVENKANFFIVGTAKAGTTSIHHYLKEHNNVYLSPIKEPNYFGSDINPNLFSNTFKKNLPILSSYFKKKPLKELQQAYLRDSDQYKMLFSDSKNASILCDSSTSYLYSEKAAEEILKYNPNSKILIVLREPTSRAYSHYLMALRFGFTTLDFIAAIKNDQNKEEKGIGQSELFIEMSLYYNSVKRFLDLFPKEQVKVLFFEDFISDEQRTMNDLFNFLNISKTNLGKREVKNQAQLPKNKSLNKLLTNLGVKQLSQHLLSIETKEKLKSIYMSKKEIPKISKEEKEFLEPFFEEDIKKVKLLLSELEFPW